jgi:hypothetical protein
MQGLKLIFLIAMVISYWIFSTSKIVPRMAVTLTLAPIPQSSPCAFDDRRIQIKYSADILCATLIQ